VFSNNFQITGLAAGEARELALLLRSVLAGDGGIYPIEERAVGPRSRARQHRQGVTALIVGMAGVSCSWRSITALR